MHNSLERLRSLASWLIELIPEQVVQDLRNWGGFTQQLRSLMFRLFGNFLTLFSNSLGIILNVLVVLVLTIMLLAGTAPYRQGFTLLFPALYRPRALGDLAAVRSEQLRLGHRHAL